WSAELVVPIRQLVIVGITVVEESTLVDDQTPCVRAGGADVPPERTGSSKASDDLDGATDVLALDVDFDIVVIDPPPAVVHEVASGRRHRCRDWRVALQRHTDDVRGEWHAAVLQQSEQTPCADGAVLVGRFHIEVSPVPD